MCRLQPVALLALAAALSAPSIIVEALSEVGTPVRRQRRQIPTEDTNWTLDDVSGTLGEALMGDAGDVDNKRAILVAAAQKICDTFPGQMCDPLIKGARYMDKAQGSKQGAEVRTALRHKMETRKPFVFATFGSSVTAGHDNHPNTSWPFQLERLVKPIFVSLGFDFELRQRAVGGYNEAPFSAGCLHNRAGSGVDAVSWEWSMFLDPKCMLESFVREAYTLNDASQPPPTIMAVENTISQITQFRSGVEDVKAQELRKSTFNWTDLEGALHDRRWKPNEWYLTEEFISKDEVTELERKLKPLRKSSLREHKHKGTFSAAQFEGVTGMKPTAEQQAHMDKSAAADAPTPWMIQKGAINPFLESGFPFETFFATFGITQVPSEWQPWYLAREKAFNINWHPGPLGHLLIASQIAHHLIEQVALSLEDTAKADGESLLQTAPKYVMPPARKECGDGVPRSCSTGMSPHNGPDITDIVLPGQEVTYNMSLDQTVHSEIPSWDERKTLFLHANDTKPLVLSVEAHQKGDIAVVCMAPCAWKCEPHKGLVTTSFTRYWPPTRWEDAARSTSKREDKPRVSDVEFSLDGKTVSSSHLLELQDKVFGDFGSFCAGCATTSEVCQAAAELDGKHELSLKVKPQTDPADPLMYAEIMQVMVVPGPRSAVLAPTT